MGRDSGLRGGGNVLFHNKTRVTGDVTAAGTVTLGNNVQVTGVVTQGASVPVCALPQESISAGSQDVYVANGTSVNLVPGAYRKVFIAKDGRLRLVSGTYRFASLGTGPDSRLQLEPASGIIEVFVKDSLGFSSKARVEFTGHAAPEAVKFHSEQFSLLTVGPEVLFQGTLVAPHAEIAVHPRAILIGACYGGKLTLGPDVKVFHVPFLTGPKEVKITSPQNSFLTKQSTLSVSWKVDGVSQTTGLTEVLAVEGFNTIKRCSENVCDSVIVIRDQTSPVVDILNPSQDTLVHTPTLTITYAVDGAQRDTVFALLEGHNSLKIEAVDEAGNRGADSLSVQFQVPASLTAKAKGPSSVFSYSDFFLDGSESTSSGGMLLSYQWRQIGGNVVTVFNSDRVTTSVLSRAVDVLVFELKVQDSGHSLAPSFDTLEIQVLEPGSFSDYLYVLHHDQTTQDGQVHMSITSPGTATSWSNEDTLVLSGTVSQEIGPFGTIAWYSSTHSGSFTPDDLDWTGLKIPLSNGDNWLTFVYSKQNVVSASRLLVTHASNPSFGQLEWTPDVLIAGQPTDFNVRIPLVGTDFQSVSLIQVEPFASEIGELKDDGIGPDSTAGDSVFSLNFSFTPSSGGTYAFRVRVNFNDGAVFSQVFLFSAQEPFSEAEYGEIIQVNAKASALYDSLLGVVNRDQAMNEVTDWLIQQPSVVTSGVGPGERAICWVYANGIHAFISDAPEGTKGGIRKIRAKGLSPYLPEFSPDDDGELTYDAILRRQNPVAYSVDTLLKNTDQNPNNVSIEAWKNWGGYKTVVISSHGNTFGYKASSLVRYKPIHDRVINGISYWLRPFQCILTNVPFTDSNKTKYWMDLNSSGLYPRMVIEAKFNTITLTPTFFKKYNPNLKGTLIYVSACRSLYNSGLWEVFRANGDASTAMIGYTDYVDIPFAGQAGKVIYSNLIQGKKLNESVDSVVKFCAKPANSGLCSVTNGKAHDNSSPPAILEFRGNKDFTLPPTSVWTWGDNRFSQLGNGSVGEFVSTPTKIKDLPSLKVSSGNVHTLLLGADSTAWAWGDNSTGVLGFGDMTSRSSPEQITGLGKVINLATNSNAQTSAAILPDSSLRLWGNNTFGQVGRGTPPCEPPQQGCESELSPISPFTNPGDKFIDVVPGFFCTFAIRKDSTLMAWGKNYLGIFGNGNTSSEIHTPIVINSVGKVKRVMSQFSLWSEFYDAAIPIARSYFLKTDGTLWGVGDNSDATIGNGSTDELIASPQQILSDVAEIGNGMDGFFAILKDGTLWRWAHRDPNDSTKVFKTPVKVSGITNAKSVARIAGVSGGAITLVLTEDGKVYGFGIHNDFGTIGDGTTQRRGAPVLLKGFDNIFQVDAGFYHSAAIR